MPGPPPPRPRRPRYRATGTALAAALCLGSLLLAPVGCGGGGAQERAPNVLLVSIDTLRADHLSCYGYERATTPCLDQLAAEGALFERTFATTSWTLPSHLSMLTGLTISAHGVCDDRLWQRTDEAGEPIPVVLAGTFLPERLREAGYRTGGFYTWKFLEPRFGFGPGFETYERLGHTFYSFPPVAERFEKIQTEGNLEALKALKREYPELFDVTRPSSPETVDRALEWISKVRGETPHAPYFCFVHLFDAHDPYTPPPPFDACFDPDYEGPIDGLRVTAPDSPVRSDMDPRDLEHLIALYDGEIAWVDSEVGRLLDALEARGALENTIVMVTSDHGEEFFDHGEKTHRHSLWVESVHVPWIVSWPGKVQRGLRIEGASGTIDLAPTLYGLLGISAPEGTCGADLSEVLSSGAANEERTYLSELLSFDSGAVPLRRLGVLRGAEHTLLEARGLEPWRARRFDLDEDPRERGAGVGVAGDGVLAATLEVVREAQRAARAASLRRPAGEAGPLTSRELAELEGLGYVGGGEVRPREEDRRKQGRLCLDGCVWPDEGE